MKTIAPWVLLVTLARVAEAAPQVLVVEDEDPVAVASDDQMVYWALRSTVRGLPVAGGQPVTLAELPEISALVATPSGLVAATEDTLWLVDRKGKKRALYRAPGRLIRAIGSEGTRVFVAEHPRPRSPGDLRRGSILAISLPGGRVRPIARNVDGAIALTVGGGHVYWPSALEIWRAPVAGGKPERVLVSATPVLPRDPEKPQPRPRVQELRWIEGQLWWQVGSTIWRGGEIAPAWPPPDGTYYFVERTLYRR